MSNPTVDHVIELLNEIRDDVNSLVGSVRITPQQVTANELSEITPNLGLVQAGEFRVGNLVDPGKGFIGTRLRYPDMTYDSQSWSLVGVDVDTMMWGVRSSDGTLVAGGGAVVLNNLGISLNTSTGLAVGRLGNLNGFIGIDSNDYGVAFGSTSQYLTYDPTNGLVVKGDIHADSITATVGSIGGWTITATALTGGTVQLLSSGEISVAGGAVFLDSNGITAEAGFIGGLIISSESLQSTNFVTGVSGFKINNEGNAEFNNVTVRGSIHTGVFVKDEVHANAGTLGVFKGAGKIIENITIPADTTTTVDFDIEDPRSGHASMFSTDDILRVKDGAVDVWFTVTAITDQTTFYRYTATKLSGSASGNIRKGEGVVDYGQSGDGFLLMTVDTTQGPFYSVRKNLGAPYTSTGQIEMVRMGNLNGFAGIDSNDVGIGIGDTTRYLLFDTTNGLRVAGKVYFGGGNAALTDAGLELKSFSSEMTPTLENYTTYYHDSGDLKSVDSAGNRHLIMKDQDITWITNVRMSLSSDNAYVFSDITDAEVIYIHNVNGGGVFVYDSNLNNTLAYNYGSPSIPDGYVIGYTTPHCSLSSNSATMTYYLSSDDTPERLVLSLNDTEWTFYSTGIPSGTYATAYEDYSAELTPYYSITLSSIPTVTSTDISVRYALAANTLHDLFVYGDTNSNILYSRLSWTNATTRTHALAQGIAGGGIYFVDTTVAEYWLYKYIGTFVVGDTAGQTQSTLQSRLVWNMYNRIWMPLYVASSDATTHTYDTTVYRQWNGDTTKFVEFVVGVNQGAMLQPIQARCSMYSDTASDIYFGWVFDTNGSVGGVDANVQTRLTYASVYSASPFNDYNSYDLTGYHYIVPTELITGTAVGTFSHLRLMSAVLA